MTEEEMIKYFSENVLSKITKNIPKLNFDGDIVGFDHYIGDFIVLRQYTDEKEKTKSIVFFVPNIMANFTLFNIKMCIYHFFNVKETTIIFRNFS